MDFQETQDIFLDTSHPPQKNFIKRESIEEMIPEGALKKESA
jgi:hypothetical protein